MKRKIFLKPPHYFFFCLILSLVLYSMIPQLNLIIFPWNLIGLILIIKGSVFVYLAWALFKKYKTPEDFQKSTRLVKEGLFKYSRNPMYSGGVVFLFGISILLGNIASLISPVLFFLIINYMFVPYEEEKGERDFDQEYLDYKKKVRRWL